MVQMPAECQNSFRHIPQDITLRSPTVVLICCSATLCKKIIIKINLWWPATRALFCRCRAPRNMDVAWQTTTPVGRFGPCKPNFGFFGELPKYSSLVLFFQNDFPRSISKDLSLRHLRWSRLVCLVHLVSSSCNSSKYINTYDYTIRMCLIFIFMSI